MDTSTKVIGRVQLIKRRSSASLQKPMGEWSVRTPSGFDIEGVTESQAWSRFLRAGPLAQLLKGRAVVASRGHVYTAPGIIAL